MHYDWHILHISTDLHSWTTTRAPYIDSSLTTYQSKFVLVGGRHSPGTTNSLWTSTTGLDWKPSLRAMPTPRYKSSSVSGGSPEVLVVAGGQGSHGKLDVVEVLLNDHWTTADSLPSSCWNMRSTFHESNFYFTGGYGNWKILFICSLESIIASASNGRTRRQTIWRTVTTLSEILAIVSYVSNLIGISYYTISSYSNKTEEWIETTSEGDRLEQKNNFGWIATAVLSTGQLLVASEDRVHKGTLSG